MRSCNSAELLAGGKVLLINVESFSIAQEDGFGSSDGVILPLANKQPRNANEGLPLVVSCESANELCNLESQKLISDIICLSETDPDGNMRI